MIENKVIHPITIGGTVIIFPIKVIKAIDTFCRLSYINTHKAHSAEYKKKNKLKAC